MIRMVPNGYGAPGVTMGTVEVAAPAPNIDDLRRALEARVAPVYTYETKRDKKAAALAAVESVADPALVALRPRVEAVIGRPLSTKEWVKFLQWKAPTQEETP